MKAIILAAGIGSRLGNLTKLKPKCMVKILENPLLFYQLKTLKSLNINNIYVVTGYRQNDLNFEGVNYIFNSSYATTNMVASLFCAREVLEMGEDVLISYGDIIYNTEILKKTINANYQINIPIDIEWKKYWKLRMENPLDDAETLKLDSKFNILEIGKKTKDYRDIYGQYMGLIKIRSDMGKRLFKNWDEINKNILHDGRTYKQMYMTNLCSV